MFRHNITSRFLLRRRILACLFLNDGHCFCPLSSYPSQHQSQSSEQKGSYCNYSTGAAGVGELIPWRGSSPISFYLCLGKSSRSFSSSMIGNGSDEVHHTTSASDVVIKDNIAAPISQNNLEQAVAQAPVMSEVSVAAAESSLPVAVLQYFIDGIHSFTGLNWWAAIALTTIVIRSTTVPLLVNQLKSTSKLTQLRPHLEEIGLQLQGSKDPQALAQGQKQIKKLFKEYGVSPFTPLKGLFIQGPIFICFYLSISNMADKMPSFKEGGAFWFTDLTTPDSLYIFPVMTSLAFLMTVELNMQEGLEGNPVAGKLKKFSRVLAFLTIPLTMNFPKAIFCYWITSNLFSLVYGLAIRRPPVKKLLGLPEVPSTPTASK